MRLITVFLISVVFGSIQCEHLEFLSEKQKRHLGELEEHELPESVRSVIRSVTLHGDATAHWCCKVSTTKTIVQSHSHLTYIKQMKQRTSYHSCGFLWLKRCARHHTYYVSAPAYTTTYTKKTYQISCPDQHLTCCKDYLLVAKHCLPTDRLPEITPDLIELQNAGKLGPGVVG